MKKQRGPKTTQFPPTLPTLKGTTVSSAVLGMAGMEKAERRGVHDEGQAKGASGSAPLDYGEEATLTLTKKKKKKSERLQPKAGAGLRVPGVATSAPASVLRALPRPLPGDRRRPTRAPNHLPAPPAAPPPFLAGWSARRKPRQRQEEPGAPAAHIHGAAGAARDLRWQP